MTRQCPKCKETKDLETGFHKSKVRKSGYKSRCKKCRNIQTRNDYFNNGPSNRRYEKLKRNYNLTPDSYNEMLIKQNNACAICGSTENILKNLSVDHCHKTGKVRGLLCGHHNRGLGLFQDNPELLRAAADYLERNTS